MSEYQYYEFRAIDRPLNKEEMEDLRDLSTRAEITPVSFTNTYHWGDFKGKPDVLMSRYFDAFVYVANWGSHRFMLRLPRNAMNVDAAMAYCGEESVSIKIGENHLVLDFSIHQEDSWNDSEAGERWMSELISIRDELMRGDYRALYLGWLASVAAGELDDDELEPPVPSGLLKLSIAQNALAHFLWIPEELIEVAAAGNSEEPPVDPASTDLIPWVKKLPNAEKEAYLVRFVSGEGGAVVRAEIERRFRESIAGAASKQAVARAKSRTVAELLAGSNDLAEKKQREKAELAAKKLARQKAEEAVARAKYLDDLAGREERSWKEVEKMVLTKQPKEYDRAVALLVDLRDLAERSGHGSAFDAKIAELRQRHAKKPSLIKRLNKKQIGK